MSKIVVVFPGVGYTVDKPLLYYGLDVAYEAGYCEIVKIAYSSEIKGDIRNNIEVRKNLYEDLYCQAQLQLSEIDWSLYDEILFISKSIGTVIASSYAENNNISVRHVLYTPLNETFMYRHKEAIAFIGTKDSFSDVEEILALSEKANVPIHVFDGCNHSLETEDALKNIEIIEKTMKITKEFIGDE